MPGLKLEAKREEILLLKQGPDPISLGTEKEDTCKEGFLVA